MIFMRSIRTAWHSMKWSLDVGAYTRVAFLEGVLHFWFIFRSTAMAIWYCPYVTIDSAISFSSQVSWPFHVLDNLSDQESEKIRSSSNMAIHSCKKVSFHYLHFSVPNTDNANHKSLRATILKMNRLAILAPLTSLIVIRSCINKPTRSSKPATLAEHGSWPNNLNYSFKNLKSPKPKAPMRTQE